MTERRFGSFTPTFDSVQLILGWDKDRPRSLRAFVTRPVQRHTVSPDRTTPPLKRFQPTIFHGPTEICIAFNMNEGNHPQKRDLLTIGLQVFTPPVKGNLDHENRSDLSSWGIRTKLWNGVACWLVYLLVYSSGDQNPTKNFDFLFAKRRAKF